MLNADDQLVLAMLTELCRSANTCVSATAVTAALDDATRARMASRVTNGAVSVVRCILSKLDDHHLIESPGFVGQQRLYGLKGTPAPDGITQEPTWARRDKVLAMVRGAAEALRRPVRLSDVISFGGSEAIEMRRALGGCLFSLTRARLLTIVHENHGRGDGGTHHYLPSDLVEKYGGSPPAESFNDLVLRAFGVLWEEHEAAALALGQKPAPMLLGDIVEKVRELGGSDEDCSHPRVLGVVRNLGNLLRPKVRRLEVGNPTVIAWVPITVVEDDVNDRVYQASDCQRATEAMRRATARTGHSAVCAVDAYKEIELDETLTLRGTETLYGVFDSAARAALSRFGRRCTRIVPYLTALGSVEGVAYYCLPEAHDVATREMALRRLVEREGDGELRQEADRIGEAVNPGILRSRVGVVVQTCQRYAIAYGAHAEDKELSVDLREVALGRRDAMRAIIDDVARDYPGALPQGDLGAGDEVSDFPIINSEELMRLAGPLMEAGSKARKAADAAKLVGNRVRRRPNPQFAGRSTGHADTATIWVYDRAAALMTLAIERGGSECRVNAQMARRELGLCRDVAVVLEALQAVALDARVTAVAAAAFIGGEALLKALLAMACSDAAPSVRLTALWAFAFASEGDTAGVLDEVVEMESDVALQQGMRQMMDDAAERAAGWWGV